MSGVKAASRSVGAVAVTGLFFLSATCAHAQKVAAEKKFGDWIVYENQDHDAETLPKRVVDAARTYALNRRDVEMGFVCSTYSVGYFLYEDQEFSDAKDGVPKIGDAKPIYTKTNKQYGLYSTLSRHGVSTLSFDQSTEELISAGNFTICPVRDEKHPACLTFSLKGFTAALKAICPKR